MVCCELHRVVAGSRLEGNATVYVVLSNGPCCCIRPLGLRCERWQADEEGEGHWALAPNVASPYGCELAIGGAGQWHDAEM